MVRFVPLDAGELFPPGRLAELIDYLEKALVDVGPPIGAERTDVLVYPSKLTVQGWNVSGFGETHRISIRIDPDCAGREDQPIDMQLRSVLAHELHHAMRGTGPGYGRTLGEALVTEGLAQCYQVEVGCPTPNYAVAVTGAALDALAVRARAEQSAAAYDHAKWFFGSRDDPDFPWSGGYSLGYALVKGWLAEQRTSASRSVHTEASAILPSAFELFERRSRESQP